MKKIFIVDSDLGFVFWLGRALDAAGYEALPARNASHAKTLFEQLKVAIDLLIIDSSMPGAAELVDYLCRANPLMKVLVLHDDPEGPTAERLAADAELYKPHETGDDAKALLVDAVGKIFGEGEQDSAAPTVCGA